MALSNWAKQALQNLQTYYKSLYYLRWFLPQKLKQHLNELERMDFAIATDTSVARLSMDLYASFSFAGWYTHLIAYLFSGLQRYLKTELTQRLQDLQTHQLMDVEHIVLLLSYADSLKGMQGLLILKQMEVVDASNKAEKLQKILAVQDLTIEESWKQECYKAIAANSNPVDFAACIRRLHPATLVLIPRLLESPNPVELVDALNQLQNLVLSPDPEMEASFKSMMIATLGVAANPKQIMEGVVILIHNRQLEPATFNVLLTSANPGQLANLMGFFGARLTLNILPNLEQHRCNIECIETHYALQDEQKLDIPYCSDLANSVNQLSIPIHSVQLFRLFDAGYAQFAGNAAGKKEFLDVFPLFNIPELWRAECQPLLSNFLSETLSQHNGLIRIKLLLFCVKSPSMVTPSNQQSIIESIQSCCNPDELLKRCMTNRNGEITAELLSSLVVQINLSGERKPTASGELRQRREAKIPSVLPQTFAKSEQEMEAGTHSQQSRPLMKSPYTESAQQTTELGMLGAVTGFIAGLIWSTPQKIAPPADDQIVNTI